MNIIPDRYAEIWPSCAYLGDEAVLIQAWKKSHEYIRRQNWYADCLELDVTAATLLPFLEVLRDQLSPSNLASYSPAPMRMVPAPKSHHWLLNGKNWTPEQDDDKPFSLRPLAHLSITDQTVATMILICLANAVETAQGESSVTEEDKAAGRYKTASYGNRLVCSWSDGRARFRWGNSQLYRKYYTDYQTYLYRSVSEAERLATEDGNTLIVRTDLSQCYDRVDRAVLIEKLKQLWSEYWQGEYDDDAFFTFLHRAFQWRWHDADASLASEHLPAETSASTQFGLPQGLAASGFFCNAYLVHFDRAVRHAIEHCDPHRSWHIRDYCRYVDDMTFVVQYYPPTPETHVVEEFVKHLNNLTAEHAPGQVIHRGKITAVLRLVQKTIEVKNRADGRPVTLDLVVLPELSVHVEDLGIVKQFISKVRCMVFCGLVFHDHPFSNGRLVNSGTWIIPQTGENGREFICIEQGKAFLTDKEEEWGVASYRPCQWVIQDTTVKQGWRLSAAICKDMTSAELHADMKNHTDGFVVSALNWDVHTFDAIVHACQFTMFQHIILVNSGQYGGSTVQAPYEESYGRILVQHHGMDQTVVSICEANLFSCREGKDVKSRPAGVVRKSTL